MTQLKGKKPLQTQQRKYCINVTHPLILCHGTPRFGLLIRGLHGVLSGTTVIVLKIEKKNHKLQLPFLWHEPSTVDDGLSWPSSVTVGDLSTICDLTRGLPALLGWCRVVSYSGHDDSLAVLFMKDASLYATHMRAHVWHMRSTGGQDSRYDLSQIS